MKFRLYREYGALNSKSIFDLCEHGLKKYGHEIVNSHEDVAVIWSVLWNGRMAGNQRVYQRCQKEHRPIIIIEVGNLIRNTTWRISLNHINNLGKFGNPRIDLNRPKKLGIDLLPEKHNRKREILIACQHEKSLQWEGMPRMSEWTENMIVELTNFTDRNIIVRPHPRNMFGLELKNAKIIMPKKIAGTYDDFDIDYNYHCVINHNSGPAVQAAIQGVPVICDKTSLASPVSGSLENIEKIVLPDRNDWFLDLCHKEWTTEEIAKGEPFEVLNPLL